MFEFYLIVGSIFAVVAFAETTQDLEPWRVRLSWPLIKGVFWPYFVWADIYRSYQRGKELRDQ